MQLEKISLEGRYVRLEPLAEIHHGDELINADTCFEVMGINRVEFMTDYLNKTSRNAIPFLGVKEEEIMRNFMFMPDSRVRDSALFSITNYEWTDVKQNLSYKLS